jgi:hypothetical protein
MEAACFSGTSLSAKKSKGVTTQKNIDRHLNRLSNLRSQEQTADSFPVTSRHHQRHRNSGQLTTVAAEPPGVPPAKKSVFTAERAGECILNTLG